MATAIEGMTLAEARARMDPVPAPRWWVGSWEHHCELLHGIRRGVVQTLAMTPGGRPVQAVAYGTAEPQPRLANYNSACGAKAPEAYCDRAARRRPVVLVLGPVHGHEVEGLTGVHHLIHILETGRDLTGTDQPALRELAEQCRLLLVPCGNPDGLARFEPASLVGGSTEDVRFWGQGTWADGTFCGAPWCKRRHPMVTDVGHLGCYFDDTGINPMHDEFFEPMGPEAPAILRLARCEAPDYALGMHSHGRTSCFLAPGFAPIEIHRRARSWDARLVAALADQGVDTRPLPEPQLDSLQLLSRPFNLTVAIHHVSGAVSLTHESPHGLRDAYRIDHAGILATQLALLRVTLEEALAAKAGGLPFSLRTRRST